jgi:hypothetical protein
MPKVNNSDKDLITPLTRDSIGPTDWFEYLGQLYLALEWKDTGSGKFSLRTVCFDPDWCTFKTPFEEDRELLVKVVYDKDVSINYTTAKIPE